ncbi:CBS domain [Ostreococcus tauri]|uniref:CBS domain n=1 Tax=Ostreococcus tauri TaxID=70448 RepID=Q015T0_OSTTA|nr:CBS domain [Ostreococcus tauri]CAL54349.1 CBS domain [Ostreococcus tauri]|eukprot:XP_003080182.1 CBS domain [Ostreococcus tauri]
MESELKRQPKLLEDELGRPRIACRDDSMAAADELFRRDVFESFACARRALESQSVLDYVSRCTDDRVPPLMLAENLSISECCEFLRCFNVSSAPVLTVDTLKFVGWFSTVDASSIVWNRIVATRPPPAHVVRQTAKLAGTPHVHSAWGVLRKAVRTVTSFERLSGDAVERREVELDNARREWLESITKEDIERAIAEALAMTLHDARRMTQSEEDGRMVSRVTATDADLLELVRSGFLRHIVSPGSEISPRQAHPCHRVCVYDLKIDEKDECKEKMVIHALISQSDIVQFLYEKSSTFDEKLTRRNLSSLGLGSRKSHRVFPDSDVLCCFPQTRLLEAFGLMHVTGRSCLGVVDEPRGKLVDVLSLTDLTDAVFSASDFVATVEDFLASRKLDRIPLAVVHEDADFIDLLTALAENAIHHVFVVDLESSPLRVVTPTDIISRLALPSARKLGWRFDSFDIHPDTFEYNPSAVKSAKK